jgi:hypothetical protein
MDMKFTGKRALCSLGLLACCALSASAFAQSNEYRRGYDQGYRDGIEAQSRQGQQYEREGERAERIRIEEARYGTRDNACDATEAVQRAIGWHRHATIVATNELCGDPDVGRQKQLRIVYRCGDEPVARVQAGEGAAVMLGCR